MAKQAIWNWGEAVGSAPTSPWQDTLPCKRMEGYRGSYGQLSQRDPWPLERGGVWLVDSSTDFGVGWFLLSSSCKIGGLLHCFC